MKWPQLVPDSVCTTPITVSITRGINQDGSPKEVTLFSGNCNYAEKQKQVLDAERRLVTLSATALFNGDIAPDAKTLLGFATVFGVRRVVFSAARERNPDGTVNFTRLELM